MSKWVSRLFLHPRSELFNSLEYPVSYFIICTKNSLHWRAASSGNPMGTEGVKLTNGLQLTPSSKVVEPYLHSPIRLRRLVLNYSNPGTILPLYLLRCHAMQSGRSLLTFRRSVLPSISGSKIKQQATNAIIPYYTASCQKAVLFIVTAVKTSNPTQYHVASWNL
jgi:hypothetical protein